MAESTRGASKRAPKPQPLQAQDKLTFLLSLVPYLMDHDRISVTDAAAHFGMTKEQIREAVRLIGVSGIPGETAQYQHEDLFDISWDDLEENDQIVLTHRVAIDDSPRFSAREAAALIAGLQYLSSLPEHADRAAIASLMAKLSRGASSTPSQVTVQSSGTDETLALIRDSVDAGVQLEFDYLNSRGERERRRVDPLRIESLDADWYLRAWCHLREAVRTFRLDRISEPVVTTEPITHGAADVKLPDTLFEGSVDDLLVTIDVAASAAPLLADYIPDGAVTVEKDGRLRTSVRVSHYHGLKRLVASMPGVALVIAPPMPVPLCTTGRQPGRHGTVDYPMTDLSPAERFAAFRTRNELPMLEAFRAHQRFDLDEFQLAACASIERGNSVLVAAPTGAGKTIVAEFAIYLAMQHTRDKVFYTAPMKALSNQKFQELVNEYGADEVGLLTGDTNINSTARIVVMTTEVLRNMLYADSSLLKNLSHVIMDEVHYLADRFRGAVWEEVIIHLPPTVRMVSLSATVSNAEEFGDWLQAVRGDTDVIVSEERPVPLEQHVLVRSRLLDLFDSSGLAATNRVNPELVQMANYGGRNLNARQSRDKARYLSGHGARNEGSRMERSELVALLDSRNLLPAIFFIFSRVGCDAAVRQVLRAGVRLTQKIERDEIRAIVEDRCRTLRDEDLAVLGYWEWLEGLERGVAAHHAGMLPAFKEVVEELFRLKLVKLVFATETLALGINMPARTVVLEKLEKFNGEARVPITPGEYTQLTGRAGRRGIDVEGHSVIQWVEGLNPQAVASLASRRTYPLNSSFTPTYNMAVNLIEQFGRERTREILESSFAQFQADRAVVDLARKVRSQQESLAGYARSMTCHLGDFTEYSTIRRELTDLERKTTTRNDQQGRGDRERRQRQLSALRTRLKQHPCHSCPDREAHARWAERWWKLKRETDKLTTQIRSRTGAVAKVFDRVTDVLLELHYLVEAADGTLTVAPPGRTLRRIYGERDLLVAESLRQGLWDSLDAPSLAAMAASLIFEPRRDEGATNDRNLPGGAFREAFDRTTDLWARLDDLETEHKLPGTNPLATGLTLAMHKWANGGSLDSALSIADLAAGDFVRWTKQTIDLLDQLSVVADSPVGATARTALDSIFRGIVAYSSVA